MSPQIYSPSTLAIRPLDTEPLDLNLPKTTAEINDHQTEKIEPKQPRSANEDAYAVAWQEPGPDSRNPMDWSASKKWTIILLVTGITLIP